MHLGYFLFDNGVNLCRTQSTFTDFFIFQQQGCAIDYPWEHTKPSVNTTDAVLEGQQTTDLHSTLTSHKFTLSTTIMI